MKFSKKKRTSKKYHRKTKKKIHQVVFKQGMKLSKEKRKLSVKYGGGDFIEGIETTGGDDLGINGHKLKYQVIMII